VNPGTDWAEQARRLVETLHGVLGPLVAPDGRPEDADAPPPACRWCPLCQLIAVLRGERPDLTAVLADVLRATADALHAFAAAPEGPRPAPTTPGDEAPVGDPPPVVQRIEIA
jgi:hypothetical protein